jgi:hypothetical protein
MKAAVCNSPETLAAIGLQTDSRVTARERGVNSPAIRIVVSSVTARTYPHASRIESVFQDK